jgi:capsular polysaccharide biosynthesis protein
MLNLPALSARSRELTDNKRRVADYDTGLLPALERLRKGWPVLAWTCGIAAGLTLVVSLFVAREYTAVSRIVIEPPAGSDPRTSMAVSPIYLESLRTYETFAASDDLFLKAVDRFQLRQGSESIDKLKKSVLKADMPRNTKILEIHATLRDPKKAHSLALYIAEETVKLNQGIAREGDRELASDAEKQASEVRARLQNAEQDWAQASIREPVEQLSTELDADEELRATLQREVVESEVLLGQKDAEGSEARDRAERYRRQLESLTKSIAAKQSLLAARTARLDRLATDRKAAQEAAKIAEARLQATRADLGTRGERLRIIDPGIVPERPSFPNIPLNVLIAILAGAVLSVLYLMAQMSYAAQKTDANRRAIRVASRHD